MNRILKIFSKPKIRFRTKKGQIIILTFVFFTVITILSATLFTKTTNFLRRTSASSNNELAFQLAESGIDYALWQFNENNNLISTPVTITRLIKV